MRGILATASRELRAYFVSPLGWVVATGFLFFNGLSFLIIVGALSDPRSMAASPFEFFFQGYFFWLTTLFVVPAITMRLLAEERQSGTIEVLMTSPVSEAQVVLGKFVGAVSFFAFLWAPTLIYAVLIDPHMKLDWGQIASAYLGMLMMGAMFLSVGLFASALSKNQMISAVLGFSMLFVFFLPPFAAWLVNDEFLKQLLEHADVFQHMEAFSKGIFDTRPLVYYLSVTGLFLFLAARSLEGKKWR